MSYSRTYLQSRTPQEISAMANLSRDRIETGHKYFDKAANGDGGYVGTGNVFSDNQRSSFVRAHSRTFCNGRTHAPGALQDFDLKSFDLPPMVERAVREEARDKDVILYEIHSHGPGGKTVHGHLITDTFYRELRNFTGQAPQCEQVMNAIRGHLAWNDRDRVDPVPAEEIEALTRDFTTDDFHALAAELGYNCADDIQGCRKSGLCFNESAPFSSWKDQDPPRTMSRAATASLASALLAIRAEMEPEDLQAWIEARHAMTGPAGMEP